MLVAVVAGILFVHSLFGHIIGFFLQNCSMRKNQNIFLFGLDDGLGDVFGVSVSVLVLVIVVVVAVSIERHVDSLMLSVMRGPLHFIFFFLHVVLLGLHVRCHFVVEGALVLDEGLLPGVVCTGICHVLPQHRLSLFLARDQSVLLGVVMGLRSNQSVLLRVVMGLCGDQSVLLRVVMLRLCHVVLEVAQIMLKIGSVTGDLVPDVCDHSLVFLDFIVHLPDLVLGVTVGVFELLLTRQQRIRLVAVGVDSFPVFQGLAHDVISLVRGFFVSLQTFPVAHGVFGLVVEHLVEDFVLMVQGLGLLEVDHGVVVHFVVEHVQFIAVVVQLLVQVHGRRVQEHHFLLLDHMMVRNTVLLVVHVLALDRAFMLIQRTVAIEPNLEGRVGALGSATVHIQTAVGGTNGLGFRVRRALVFTVKSSALLLTNVELSRGAVEESSGVSAKEIDGALVGLDMAVGVAGAREVVLVLKAILVQHLGILGLAGIGGRLPFRGSTRGASRPQGPGE